MGDTDIRLAQLIQKMNDPVYRFALAMTDPEIAKAAINGSQNDKTVDVWGDAGESMNTFVKEFNTQAEKASTLWTAARYTENVFNDESTIFQPIIASTARPANITSPYICFHTHDYEWVANPETESAWAFPREKPKDASTGEALAPECPKGAASTLKPYAIRFPSILYCLLKNSPEYIKEAKYVITGKTIPSMAMYSSDDLTDTDPKNKDLTDAQNRAWGAPENLNTVLCLKKVRDVFWFLKTK